jgi:hypothetical protein
MKHMIEIDTTLQKFLKALEQLPKRLVQCPGCKKNNNGEKTIDLSEGKGKPKLLPVKPGDVTVCLHCLKIVVFTDQLQLRSITQDEHIKLVDDSAAWEELKRKMERAREGQQIMRVLKELPPSEAFEFLFGSK